MVGVVSSGGCVVGVVSVGGSVVGVVLTVSVSHTKKCIFVYHCEPNGRLLTRAIIAPGT